MPPAAGPGELHERARLRIPMLRFLATAGRKWLRFAEILGNIQFTSLLSLLYWTIFMIRAVRYTVVSDRLALRDARRARWIQRIPGADWLDSMRKQG